MNISMLKHLWLYELQKCQFVTEVRETESNFLPSMPISEILEMVKKIHAKGGGIIQLCEKTQADVCVEVCISQSKTKYVLPNSVSRTESTLLVSDLKSDTILNALNSNTLPEYIHDQIHTLFKSRPYIISNNATWFAGASFGQVYPTRPNEKRIAICTPSFKRFRLLRLYVQFMRSFYIPYLQMSGLNTTLIITGADEEREALLDLLQDDSIFFWHENNLGAKKNAMLDLSRDLGVDYITYIDSDDFIHPATTMKLIEIAESNGYWSAIEPFIFFDAKSKTHGLFEGYTEKHSLYKWGMGSGRVFTKGAIEALGKDPFAKKNKSMDFYIREQLSGLNIPHEERILTLDKCDYLPIGLKSNENIWAYDKYKLTELKDFSTWLPRALEKEFFDIPFDAEV